MFPCDMSSALLQNKLDNVDNPDEENKNCY